MIDVLIVDDHALLAGAMQVALVRSGIAADTATPGPPPQLVDELLRRRPAVVLLDLDLGEHGDSTPVIGPLTDSGVRVVLVTGVRDQLRIARALEAGALAFRDKSESLDALLATVRLALSDGRPQDTALRADLLERLRRARAEHHRTRAPYERLTDRERATLRALAEGLSVREIAIRWVVSEATVRSHVRAILTKLQAGSQLAAVVLAIRKGWVEAAPTLERSA